MLFQKGTTIVIMDSGGNATNQSTNLMEDTELENGKIFTIQHTTHCNADYKVSSIGNPCLVYVKLLKCFFV